MQCEHSSLGTSDLYGRRRRGLAAPLALPGSTRGASGQRQEFGRVQFMVLVTVEAAPAKPGPPGGSFSEMCNPGDRLCLAEVAWEHPQQRSTSRDLPRQGVVLHLTSMPGDRTLRRVWGQSDESGRWRRFATW